MRAVFALAGALIVSACDPTSPTLWYSGDSIGVSIRVSEDACFSISVRNEIWFQSAATELLVAGVMRSSADGSLKLDASDTTNGNDASFGNFSQLTLNWTVAADGIVWSTFIKAFDDDKTISFGQQFHTSIPNFSTNVTAISPNSGGCGAGVGEGGCWGKPGSGWPTIDIDKGRMSELGYVNYGEIGRTTPGNDWAKYKKTGPDGVPLALLDEKSGTVALLSPTSAFYDTVFDVVDGAHGSYLRCGVIGSAQSIPAGFSTETVMHIGEGMTSTFMSWGGGLLRKYGKERAAHNVNVQVRLFPSSLPSSLPSSFPSSLLSSLLSSPLFSPLLSPLLPSSLLLSSLPSSPPLLSPLLSPPLLTLPPHHSLSPHLPSSLLLSFPPLLSSPLPLLSPPPHSRSKSSATPP
jgi:hypothetical protein